MREIKFRGRCLDNGNLVFGHFWQTDTFGTIVNGIIVDPKSVAQLVGYDCDGNEVYEGDVLVNDSGKEFQASFKSVIISLKNPSYCRYLENLKHRKYYRLKGRDKNADV